MKRDLLSQLTSAVSEIVPKLFPNGKRKGSEWVLGSLNGEPGSSLSINLKTGLWADFSQSGVKGNMISLFTHKNNGDVAAGIKEAHELLKLPLPVIQNSFKKVKIDWEQKFLIDLKPIQYLINDRLIPAGILKSAKIRASEDEYIFVGYDESNKISYAQYTKSDRNGDGKKEVRFSPKYKPVLWGMHSLPDKQDYSSIVITEGVIDALSFRASGINAVSIPSGVTDSNWIEHSWNFLHQFESIYLCFDGDEAGQLGAEKVASKLGISRCKNVRLSTKDANELWIQSTENERGADVSLFQKYIDEAKDFKPVTFAKAGELLSRSWEMAKEGPKDQIGDFFCGWKDMRVPFRVRPGEVSIYTGYAGHGKTTMVLQHIAHQIFVLGKSIALASLEIDSEDSIIRIITQGLGFFPDTEDKFMHAGRILSERLHIYNVKGKAKIDELNEFFDYCVHRHNCSEIVLDSLMRTDMDIQGTDRAETYNKYFSLVANCLATGAHAHILAHPIKGKDDAFEGIPSMNDVKGIGEIVDNAFNVITIWRNKIKQGKLEGLIRSGQHEEWERKNEEWDDARFIIQKNRYGQVCGATGLWFDPKSYRWRTQFQKRKEYYVDVE